MGFPFGRKAGNLPIWKRAYVASEPEYEIEKDMPFFYVDTASRKGMSGSPVVIKKRKSVILFSKSEGKSSMYFTKFIGIYSGRIGVYSNGYGEDVQLGKVWKSSVIDDLLRGNIEKR